MVTKRMASWSIVIGLVAVLSLLVACGSSPATTTKPKTTTPAATTPAATAPKAVHEAAFAASPAGCTTCHTVGGAGVGAAGGVGMATSHTGRANDTCKSCHQLGS